ncbi:uncharacterized protein LOC111291107 [Durio zibethinus]|uniref:Uncharacterized protein LOC111291107 n=1 Tax=Durio zibethinus TaxID=66656 RepID=A0A6P5YD22_DURZI|nr:uncharacterized protein LOC111291107 [Durio zibethinus]
MPGPGPHLMYAMSSGVALTHLTKGRFSPHHTLTYTLNAFFGPDIGSFSEWLSSTFFAGSSFVSSLADAIHHPFYYVFILGFPLCVFYSWVSSVSVRRGLLDSVSGVPLSRSQCLLLMSAGSLSHFFLDHLFEENGHSSMYTWILSTGWWINRAPVNPDAVIVVGLLCTCLIGGFLYINRARLTKSTRKQSYQSMKLILIIASLYCLWCASQIYWVNPRRPAVGEEADLGVLLFMATYFFLPHCLCILSMNSEDLRTEQLPL